MSTKIAARTARRTRRLNGAAARHIGSHSLDDPGKVAARAYLAAGVEAGTIRPEPAAGDVFTILAGIFFATRDRRDTAGCALDIVMEGLRRH